VRGTPAGAGVLLDGDPVGNLPLDALRICPGSHELIVSYGGRRIWLSTETVEVSGERVVEVFPRPNVVLVGADGWPPRVETLARYSRAGTEPLPLRADMSETRSWRRIDLPRDTDLALAVVPGDRSGAADELQLYSPILDVTGKIRSASDLARPRWTRAAWGFDVADSRVGGLSRVVEVTAGGPAQRAGLVVGDRIVAAGGVEVGGAVALRRILAVASPNAPLRLRWSRADSSSKEADLRATVSPWLVVEKADAVPSMVRAAWAAVDAAAADDAASAAANMALLLSAFGRSDEAIEMWRNVNWGERAGVGNGTARYYLGVDLLRAGREREAAAAFREAASSGATAFDDAGPAVAPAARDRLADLGVR